jgi:four helix bundle protein
MNSEELKRRMRHFGLAIIRLVQDLPRGRVTDMIAGQLLRSGTSPGANYRAACRGKSRADFIAKMGIVEEELDESDYWLDMLVAGGFLAAEVAAPLRQEAGELLRITVASINTAKAGRQRPSQ